MSVAAGAFTTLAPSSLFWPQSRMESGLANRAWYNK